MNITKIEVSEHQEPNKDTRIGFYRDKRNDLFYCIKPLDVWYVTRILTGHTIYYELLPNGLKFVDGVITITQKDRE